MGYLLTVEAPDASGKSTQVSALCEKLKKDGFTVRLVRFPNYGSDACKPVELYLNGALGAHPSDTNAYAASVFFAVDRYFSYHTDWIKDLAQQDTVVILDRYTTSNAIHQCAKIDDPAQKEAFLDWLYDFEFDKLGLPKPDDTIFLDVPPALSLALLKKRAKTDDTHVTDIHEADENYLKVCYKAASFAADKKNWKRIVCEKDGAMRSVQDISDEIYAYVKGRLLHQSRLGERMDNMVYIFLADGFEEIEALTQVDYLKRAGIDIKMCGVGKMLVTGGHGIEVKADMTVDEVDIDSAEMLILPGGLGGVDGILKSKTALALLQTAFETGKKISAICAAPTILAKQGFLKGRKCICYPGMEQELTQHGGTVCDKAVVCDGPFITAKAAGASEQFAFALIESLTDKACAQAVREGICAR